MNQHFLDRIPLFADLDTKALQELSTNLEKETIKSNQVIFWMGDNGDKLYIIQHGRVAISYIDEEGSEVNLANLHSGAFFGELSLIDGMAHTATARAVDDVTLLTLSQENFYRFIDKHPALSRTIMFVLASRLRMSTVRLQGVKNVNQEIESTTSRFQRSIDRLAKSLTSAGFLASCVVFILVWIVFQVLVFKQHHYGSISFADRPPTFFLLGFIITLTSFLLTILILTSQRRQAESDRLRGEIEYQVNLKAQSEVIKLQAKMDTLLSRMEKNDKM